MSGVAGHISTELLSYGLEALRSYLAFFLRCGAALAILPLGDFAFSIPKRIAAAFFLTLLFGSGFPSPALGFGSAISEIILGFLVMLPAACLVESLIMAVELYETSRGQNMSQLLDPLHGTESGAAQSLARFAVIVWLFQCGAPHIVFGSFFGSFSQIPAGTGTIAVLPAFAVAAFRIGAESIQLALSMAAPFLILFVCIELALAFVERAIPQLSLSAEAYVMKHAAGLVVLLAVVGALRPHRLPVERLTFVPAADVRAPGGG